ncbi:hypothetical protein D6T64_17590 [Cryobacterium melibiosiphilum]|uniref:Uncharacterized protein n=1 Tax=Cryobacterium melibiosiphilum TaxID=995039 RepID=A0A3A5MM12_9MICO|nr:hypothetical protein [Cryobacterium melibiosiphilum]RJT86092.1 hypothetical protein D6T64_17590 [Cryobacterium melibiosiphilum]
MSREPDGFWTDEDREVTEIDPNADEELVLGDDDDDVDLDDWGTDADERPVEGDSERSGDRDFYRDDL